MKLSIPMTRYSLLAATAAGTLLAGSGIAFAMWSVTSDDGANAGARGGAMPSGGLASAVVSGTTATVSWQGSQTDGHAVAGYTVKRYSDANVAVDATSGCSGTLSGTTSCVESGVPDGRWRYAVTPVQKSWLGAEGDASDQVLVYSIQPTVTTSFPGVSTSYGVTSATQASSLGGCPGAFCGDIVHSSVAPVAVKISVRKNDGGFYWNAAASAFNSTAESWVNAAMNAGGVNAAGAAEDIWYAPFPVGNFTVNGAYTLHVVATDSRGGSNEQTVPFLMYPLAPPKPKIVTNPGPYSNLTNPTFSFTSDQSGVSFECSLDSAAFSPCDTGSVGYSSLAEGKHTFKVHAKDAVGNVSPDAAHTWAVDVSAPTATDVQATNKAGGTAGVMENGDVLTFTYSEPLNAGSVKSGWTGTATPVVVKVAHGASDTITVYSGSNQLVQLGTVDLKRAGFVLRDVAFDATMVATSSGSIGKIVITLGAPTVPADVATAAVGAGAVEWLPGVVTDRAGNQLSIAGPLVVVETGITDADF